MDLAEFVSDYVRMLKDNGEWSGRPAKKQLAREIAEAYGEANPDLAELDDNAFMDTVYNGIAPQVEYYLS